MDCNPQRSELRERQAGIGLGWKGSARDILVHVPQQLSPQPAHRSGGAGQGADSPCSAAAMLRGGGGVSHG